MRDRKRAARSNRPPASHLVIALSVLGTTIAVAVYATAADNDPISPT